MTNAFAQPLTKLALASILLAAGSLPAFAVNLAFDAACGAANAHAIPVQAPNTGITFRKNPNSPATRGATATIRRTSGGANTNIVIPVAVAPGNWASCFYTPPNANAATYCFQARGAAAILNIDGVANTNVAGAPACQ